MALVPKEAVISGDKVGGTITRDTIDGDGDVILEVDIDTNCVPIPPVARSAIEAP